jgi:hypothetical protein
VANLNDFINVTSSPATWNAAHKPIIYEGLAYGTSLTTVADNAGFAQFTINVPFVLTLAVGQLIYVATGVYTGWHTIKSVQSTTQFTTETVYTTTIAVNAAITYFPILEFQLLTGYKSTEEYPNELPLTFTATFKVEPNTKTFSYKWDVSGYLKSIFTIIPPQAGIDFSKFNRFRLFFVGVGFNGSNIELESYQVANSAIENPDFNTIYANTGQPLNAQETIYFNCGETINSIIEGGIIRTYINDGCIVEGFESNDFDNNDFIINICNT